MDLQRIQMFSGVFASRFKVPRRTSSLKIFSYHQMPSSCSQVGVIWEFEKWSAISSFILVPYRSSKLRVPPSIVVHLFRNVILIKESINPTNNNVTSLGTYLFVLSIGSSPDSNIKYPHAESFTCLYALRSSWSLNKGINSKTYHLLCWSSETLIETKQTRSNGTFVLYRRPISPDEMASPI
ncbi:hypothetical protein TNCV_4439591 [Trichonephila clavipes]|nr:hypothetical protein TNCV_4439591 [Trichonephila clavipes]